MAVIGDNVRKVLFGEHTVAPGDTFSINGLPFRIVGLMPPKDQNSSYNGLDSDKIFVPYATMVRDLPPDDTNFHPGIVSDMIYVPADLKSWKQARAQVTRVLARNHQFDPEDPSAVHYLGHGGKCRTGGQHVHLHDGFPGRHRGSHADPGRSRRDEYHAGLGYRTHARDRPAQGIGRYAPPHSGGLPAGRRAARRHQRPRGWAGAYGVAAAVNTLPKREMFAGLPVNGATTAMAFGALAVIAVSSALWPAWRAARLTPVEALSYER